MILEASIAITFQSNTFQIPGFHLLSTCNKKVYGFFLGFSGISMYFPILCDCNLFITAALLQENTSFGTKQKLRSPLKYQINLANRCDEFRDFHNLSTLTHLVTFELISFQFTCISDLPQNQFFSFCRGKKNSFFNFLFFWN